MEKTERIWMDGSFVKWDDAKIHVLTHSLHYGSAIFEGLRFYPTAKGPAIFRLSDHMARFTDSAKIHQIKLPYSEEELADAIVKLVKINGLKEGYIRPIAFYGAGSLRLSPKGCPMHVAIACYPFGAYLGEKGIREGVKCKISSWTRITANILPPQAKCTANYANSILAYHEAQACGCEEAIMLDHDGNISEGPAENVFIVHNGHLLSPPEESDILRGVTRHVLIHFARDMGLKTVLRHIPRDEIYVAEEAFFCGTAAEVTPIREIDGRLVGNGKPGPITQKLQKKYADVVRGKEKKYLDWLTVVK